jgi:hypothetical protein
MLARLTICLFAAVVAFPALAQQSVEQQVYTATASVMHTVANLGQRVMDDEAEIAVLKKQNLDLIKERDALKAAAAPGAPPAKAPTTE